MVILGTLIGFLACVAGTLYGMLWWSPTRSRPSMIRRLKLWRANKRREALPPSFRPANRHQREYFQPYAGQWVVAPNGFIYEVTETQTFDGSVGTTYERIDWGQ